VGETDIILLRVPLKRDTRSQRDKKRNHCRRAAIELLIGHLKHNHRLGRCFLKGVEGDQINLLMAACAWNLKKWLKAICFAWKTPAYGHGVYQDRADHRVWNTGMLIALSLVGLQMTREGFATTVSLF
jgi:hypothetical protein